MGCATEKKIGPAPWDPGEGSKVQISFNFNFKVNFKDFIPNLVCVLTNERYKTYQMEFLFLLPGSYPRGWTWGAKGPNQIPSCCLFVMLSPPKP